MRKILSQRKGLYLHRQSRKYPGTGLQVPGHGQLGGKEMSILAQTEAAAGFSIIWILVMLVALYFMMIRPQQKENKRKNAMLAELAVFPCRNRLLPWWRSLKTQRKKKVNKQKAFSGGSQGMLFY